MARAGGGARDVLYGRVPEDALPKAAGAQYFAMDAGEDVGEAPAAGRPAPLLEVLPQEQAQRSTVEQIVDPVLEVPMLQMVAPQMVEQLVDILTPKIVCPPRAGRTVLGAPQTVALFFLRQGSPGDLHRAPRRGSAGSRREVRGSLEESLVRDTRRTATLAEGTGGHADLGFKHSRLHPGFFYHQGRDIALVSHVDDLLIGVWPYSVSLLVKMSAFLGTLHWPAGVVEFGVGGVFHLLRCSFCMSCGLVKDFVLRVLFLGIGGLDVQFQCRLFLLVQALIFGAPVGFLELFFVL